MASSLHKDVPFTVVTAAVVRPLCRQMAHNIGWATGGVTTGVAASGFATPRAYLAHS